MEHIEPPNPRAAIGGNSPPITEILAMFAADENFSETISQYLKEKYASFFADAAKLLDEARALPASITDKEERAKFPPIIKRIRDLKAKFESFHELEKAPFRRGGDACDSLFFGTVDKLARRNKNNNAGASDILGARLTDYDNRVLAEEDERREAERKRLLAEAQAAEAARQKAEREAEELRLAAERARKPEIIEAKQEVAAAAEEAASAARVQATVTLARAEEAHIATLAKPADIMRDRGEDGTKSTMAQEKYAEIVDRSKLDLAELAPFIPLKALETALNGWARQHDYRKEMPGAKVGRKNRTRVL